MRPASCSGAWGADQPLKSAPASSSPAPTRAGGRDNAREPISPVGASRMSQEIKTVLIAISATLAALLVHHALEQAQASARPFASPTLSDLWHRFRSSREADATPSHASSLNPSPVIGFGGFPL